MKLFCIDKAQASHNHEYKFDDFIKRERLCAQNFNKLISLQPEIKNYIHCKAIKHLIFSIFSSNIFLWIFKKININFYWYFT